VGLIKNMAITALSIGCIVFYIAGALFTSLLTGWDFNKVTDLFKIALWPITIFLKH